MRKQNIITLLENCYQIMAPAYLDNSMIFAWFTGIPHSLFNIITRFSYKKNVTEKIEKIIAEAPTNTTLSFWKDPVHTTEGLESILADFSFQSTGFFSAMRWPVKKQTEGIPLEIRPADIYAFRQITALCFGFHEDIVDGWIRLLQNGEHESYLAYLNGNPVGAGTLFLVNKQIGVIFNIATLPSFRKRGIGRAMMLYLMNRAHELQLKELILASAPMAKKLYANLGFKTEHEIEVFMNRKVFTEFR
jgi:N-acetylglutamate synthase-like GNAT family acetyltransferase